MNQLRISSYEILRKRGSTFMNMRFIIKTEQMMAVTSLKSCQKTSVLMKAF